MTAKSWSGAQAKNHKGFKSRLDKISGWLVDGDWHGSFGTWTEAQNDSIVNYPINKKDLTLSTLEFSRVGEALQAVQTWVENGATVKETFIVGVQPYEKTFYMYSTEHNDLAFGSISRKSGTISVVNLADEFPGNNKGLGVYQFSDLA